VNPSSEPSESFAPLHPERLTWAALLGRWIEFAKSALALPDDDPGGRLRRCVPDIIMLQAVWFSLANLEELDPAERALGLDRAGVLVEKHTAALEETWRGVEMPLALRELISDAVGELRRTRC
jgi:hypothetical protein